MTKIKRLVAVALAVLMILGSLSMAASAWDAAVDGGFNLGIETKIFRKVGDEWIETGKVEPGEKVKARVYLSTDYYANSGDLLFFYNTSFFTDEYSSGEETLVINPYYQSYPYTITGKFKGAKSTSTAEQAMVKRNAISQEFADAHDFVQVVYYFDPSSYNQKFNGKQWFCEFDLTVKADASKSDQGDFFALESTTTSPAFTKGIIDIPKGEYNTKNASTASMTDWTAVLDYKSNPVTLFGNMVKVTFNANDGLFEGGKAEMSYEGEEGESFAPVAPERPNYVFKGWAISGTDTIVDATVFPAANTSYDAVWEVKGETGNGEAVDFETRFFRLDEETGEWVYTEKAKRGEALKARVYIRTNYYTNAGDVIVFYNNQFFTDTYPTNIMQPLVVNETEGSAVENDISGGFAKLLPADEEVQKLVSDGYITSSFAEQHNAFTIKYKFNDDKDPSVPESTGAMLDYSAEKTSNDWLFEFDLQVSSNASGKEYFWIEENTIMNPDGGIYAFINVPVSTEGGLDIDVIGLHSINVSKTVINDFVELESTLTFDADGGVFAENNADKVEITDYIGATVIAPKNPDKEGFTFMGWADEEGNKTDVPATMPYDDTTLTAIWQPEVDISYDTDGDGVVDVTETVTSGAEFVAPAEPTKEGYEFIGWAENDPTGATVTPLPDVYPDDDTEYYAVFDAVSYDVNYFVRDLETNEYKLVAEVPTPYGEAIAHAPSTAYKAPEGYRLSEAYTNSALTNLLPADAKMPAKEVDVFFKLEANTYTATFDAAEGAWADGETTKTVDAKYNTQIVAPEDPTRKGFTFVGWTPDVDVMDDIDGEYYTAVWVETVYYATYKVDGAEYQVYDHTFGEVIDYPADPVKEGYTFKGWTNYTEGMTMPYEDVEFIAVFEVNKYDAIFDAGEGHFGTVDAPEVDDEGNVVTEKTVPTEYGKEIVAPADPVREGYTFSGWDPIVPKEMPAEETTFIAKWSPNTDTPYVVEIYTMDTEGNYGTPVVQNKTGTTGTTAEVTPNAGEGMYLDEETEKTPEKSVLSAEILPDGSTVLKVYYARNEFKITFDANDGKFASTDAEGNAVELEEIVLDRYYGASVAAPADPSLTGYTFKGWEPAVVNKAIEDATYVAKWEVNKYTITFDTDGGTEIGPITDDFGADIDVPAEPTKEGYTFIDWVNEKDEPVEVPTTMPAEDTNLKAKWEINKYDISLDANGGKLADGNETYAAADVEYATDLAAYGVPMTVLDREGYTFLGWSEAADATAAEIAEIPAAMPAGDIIYYAVWEINEHTITFDTDGGTEIDPITGDYGSDIKVPEDPTKEGYTFAGWVDEKGNAADVPVTMPDKDVNLKATWDVVSYKVTYSGEEITTTEYDVDYGASIPVPEVPTRTGYTFGGWYEKTSGKANTDYTSMPAANLEFVAKWNSVDGVEYYFDVYKMGVDGTYPTEPERSVLTGEVGSEPTVKYSAPAGFKLESYKLSGKIEPSGTLILYAYVAREEYKFTAYKEADSAEVVAEGKYLYEAPVASVATPEKDGYVFDGWVDANGDAATIPTTMPAKDVTVYAAWVKGSFNASFDAGKDATFPNGDQVVTDPTELDAPIEAPADEPTKDGYDFVGWAPADDPENVITDGNYGNMDSDGEDFVAVWEKATYTVTFYDYVPADGGKISPTVKDEIVSAEYDYEEKIIFPSVADRYEYEHWTFMGWTLVENKPIITDEYTEEMLAELLVDTETAVADHANADENGNINYYAVYKRVKVMLIPKNDTCTTIIDRNGLTVDDYEHGVSEWYVYGLTDILKDTVLLAEYIDVQGDGRIELIYSDRASGGTQAPWTGTGTIINVYDNVTGELAESFTIIIYGDLNGDSYITATDVSILDAEVIGLTHWSVDFDDTYAPYRIKAADLGGADGVLSARDVAVVDNFVLGLYLMNQDDGTYVDLT